MATSSSRGRTSSSSSKSSTASSSSSKSSTASSSSSPSSRGNISGSSSPSGSISGGSSSISAGSSYGGFGSSAPSASISGGSSSGSSTSGSISGGSNTISVSNFSNPSFSPGSTSSTISSSGNISSLGKSPFATVSSPNTGLAAFGLGSLQTGLVSTSNQLGQGFQVSNQSGVAATASRLGAALSSFIGPVNPTKPTVLTPPQALIPDLRPPPVNPIPFIVIDTAPGSKTTAGDIPKDSQDIPTTLTQNIIKYTPYLILAFIIYAGISLVKK